MIPLLGVMVSFALMALSDTLKLRGRTAAGKKIFLAGIFALVSSMLWALLGRRQLFMAPLPRFLCFIAAGAGGWAEYTALVKALPAKEAYFGKDTAAQLVTDGIYALCRHPGALFFPLLSLGLSLGFASRGMLEAALLASLLNLFYVWFQDRFVFPRLIPGYEGYQESTPFLLPTAQSLRRAAGK